jgi:hypothetical protein
MNDYHNGNLPATFNNIFKQVTSVHNHNTKLASRNTYYIDKIRTNYGKFKAWNDIDDKYKTLSKSSFKNKIAENMIFIY